MLDDIRDTLRLEANAILYTADNISEEFNKAIQMLMDTYGHIVLVGVGKSGIIGKKIAATLSCVGTPAIVLHPTEARHGDLGTVTRDDLILMISYSGETEELINLAPSFKNIGNKIIVMTGNPTSTLANLADCVINIFVDKEACPYNITPTTSSTVTLAIGDALALALLKLKKQHKKDFLSVHPAGALGTRLKEEANRIHERRKN
jgi:arabinose-5-phosphate isomerase